MTATFSKETREKIYKKYWYQCFSWKDKKCKGKLSIHHLVHNTKINVKLYGNKRIQSEENGILVCDYHHIHFGNYNKLRQEVERLFKKSN